MFDEWNLLKMLDQWTISNFFPRKLKIFEFCKKTMINRLGIKNKLNNDILSHLNIAYSRRYSDRFLRLRSAEAA